MKERKKEHLQQCDQIGGFFAFWVSIQSRWQQLFFHNSSHCQAIFVTVSKSLFFLVKSFLGNFYKHLAIFYFTGHTEFCSGKVKNFFNFLQQSVNATFGEIKLKAVRAIFDRPRRCQTSYRHQIGKPISRSIAIEIFVGRMNDNGRQEQIVIKRIKTFGAAAIAPWFHLGLPFCGPRFESRAHLCFFNLYCLNCN